MQIRKSKKVSIFHDSLSQTVSSISTLFVYFLSFADLPIHRCGDSVYRYPLADYTGTAEVVNGGASGYNGLGTVTAYSSHPSLPYNSLYFDGSATSFAELRVGTQYNVETDWSFTMFVYSVAPHTGTIFDFVYDGPSLSGQLYSTKIKLELNDSQIVLTMLGPSGQDYGSDILGTIFTSEAWVPLSIVHDTSSGDVIIQTYDNEFYESKNYQNNQNNVNLPQPANIKIGGAYGVSSPFKGSIVCFALYDTKFSKSSFDATLDECNPGNWPNTPSSIDLSTLTTQPPPTTTSSTTPTTTALPTTSTSTTSTTAISTTASTTTPTTTPENICPDYYGYFIAVAVDTKPSVAAMFAVTQCKSNRQCGHLCLIVAGCRSFTYSKLTALCLLFDEIFETTTEAAAGTHYYKRKDIC